MTGGKASGEDGIVLWINDATFPVTRTCQSISLSSLDVRYQIAFVISENLSLFDSRSFEGLNLHKGVSLYSSSHSRLFLFKDSRDKAFPGKRDCSTNTWIEIVFVLTIVEQISCDIIIIHYPPLTSTNFESKTLSYCLKN